MSVIESVGPSVSQYGHYDITMGDTLRGYGRYDTPFMGEDTSHRTPVTSDTYSTKYLGLAPVVIGEGRPTPTGYRLGGVADFRSASTSCIDIGKTWDQNGLLNGSYSDIPKLTELPSSPGRPRSRSSSPVKPASSDYKMNGYSHDADSGVYSSVFSSPSRSYRGNTSSSLPRYRSVDNIPASKYDTPTRGYDNITPSRGYDTPTRGYETNTFTKAYDDSPTKTSDYSSPTRLNKTSSFESPSKLSRSFGLDRSMDRPRSPTRIGGDTFNRSPLDRSSRDVEQSLADSEDRRNLLVEKLKDARQTIKLQADRLEMLEGCAKEAGFTVDDLKFREREQRRRINNLEKEKQEYQTIRLDSLRTREELQEKITSLDIELRTLKAARDLSDTECKQREEILRHTMTSITKLESENEKLNKTKDTLQKEMLALKESLEIARERNETLENHSHDNKAQIDNLNQENRRLSSGSKDVNKQISELKSTNQALKDENNGLISAIKATTEEKRKILVQMETCQDAIADLKATLATTSSDKERFFQEKLDLHQRLQNVSYEKETLYKERVSLDDQVGELNAELAQAKLQTDKRREEQRQVEDELAAVKKVSEVLSLELANTKSKLEKSGEHAVSLEQTKKIAFQQHALYEQEIKTLETQLDNMRKSMEAVRKEHVKNKESVDENTVKLRDELKEVKSERNDLELKHHELNARLKQSEQNLKEHSDIQQKELETWKTSCEKLTASLSRKEMEIQTLNKRLHDLEDEHMDCVRAKRFQKSQEENRRLLQERAENQQVIQLLEMQKSILAKTSEGNISRMNDTTELKLKIEELESENMILEDKVKKLEKVRDNFIHQREEKLQYHASQYGIMGQPQTNGDINGYHEVPENTQRVRDLERQNKQLREVNNMVTEQLNRLEKSGEGHAGGSNGGLVNGHSVDTVPKTEVDRLVLEKENAIEELQQSKVQLQHELQQTKIHLQQAERTHKKYVASKEKSHIENENTSTSVLRKEKQALENELSMVQSQVELAEASKKRAEELVTSLEHQVKDIQKHQQHSSNSQSSQVQSLQKLVNQLQSELDSSKNIQTKQDTLINTLKEQSLDDVGEELNQMRTELHKLMAVIQMKDNEIETLEHEIKKSKFEITQRERQIEDLKLKVNTGSRNDTQPSMMSYGREKGDFDEELTAVQRERDDLTDKIQKLKSEKDAALLEAKELRDGLDDLQNLYDEERKKMQNRLRLELAAKDRQIESLEEQLARTTSFEIKKLRRDASKVELLKAQNRRLSNQLNPSSSLPKWLHEGGEEGEFEECDEMTDSADCQGDNNKPNESWDSSEDIESSPVEGETLETELAKVRAKKNADKDSDVKRVDNASLVSQNVSVCSSAHSGSSAKRSGDNYASPFGMSHGEEEAISVDAVFDSSAKSNSVEDSRKGDTTKGNVLRPSRSDRTSWREKMRESDDDIDRYVPSPVPSDNDATVSSARRTKLTRGENTNSDEIDQQNDNIDNSVNTITNDNVVSKADDNETDSVKAPPIVKHSREVDAIDASLEAMRKRRRERRKKLGLDSSTEDSPAASDSNPESFVARRRRFDLDRSSSLERSGDLDRSYRSSTRSGRRDDTGIGRSSSYMSMRSSLLGLGSSSSRYRSGSYDRSNSGGKY